MGFQLSVAARNASLDSFETVVGTSPILRIRTGVMPANCAAADLGVVLATLNLPADWMAAAANGTKTKSGTWEDASADAGGLGGHFRLYRSNGTTCDMQGWVAQNWAPSYAVQVGHQMVNNGLLYRCITAGTTAASGGPTGTGTSIDDGTAEWDYVDNGGYLIIDNTSFAPGQGFSIATFSRTAANA